VGEQESAVEFPRAERLLPAPPSREDEALLHAFPAPLSLADPPSAGKRADAAASTRGRRFPTARVLLLLVLTLIVWFVASRAASG
jgi:hypothetical protein